MCENFKLKANLLYNCSQRIERMCLGMNYITDLGTCKKIVDNKEAYCIIINNLNSCNLLYPKQYEDLFALMSEVPLKRKRHQYGIMHTLLHAKRISDIIWNEISPMNQTDLIMKKFAVSDIFSSLFEIGIIEHETKEKALKILE